ncbi:hypothetical protein C0431_12865 [bacterium]|nr:hypothetical protein [bacterium]
MSEQNNKHFYTYLHSTAVGRLTRDPELRGDFHDFCIAVNHQNGETSFIDLSVNKNNSFLMSKVQFLKKGRLILVSGIQQIKPKGEGKTGSYVSIRPEQIMFLDTDQASQGQGQGQAQGQPQQQQYAPQGQQQQYAPQGQQQQQYAPQGQPQQPFGTPQQQYAPQGQPMAQQQQGFAPPHGMPQQQPFGAPPQNPFATRG